jgi:hypothetical protein
MPKQTIDNRRLREVPSLSENRSDIGDELACSRQIAARSGKIVNHPKGPGGSASAPEIVAAFNAASSVNLRARKTAFVDLCSALDGISSITLKRTLNNLSSTAFSCAIPPRTM